MECAGDMGETGGLSLTRTGFPLLGPPTAPPALGSPGPVIPAPLPGGGTPGPIVTCGGGALGAAA
jgi:hypothetical protein